MEMLKVYNASPDRVAILAEGSDTYRVEPESLAEFPAEIAHRLVEAWPSVRLMEKQRAVADQDIWELRAGPAFEAAQREFNIDIHRPKDVEGPARPPVQEEKIPDDAYNEDGTINAKETNTHTCTYCAKDYSRIGDLRNHMRKEHNV